MTEKRQRIPELDGLRVLMIFIVSWYHIWQQSWLRPYIGTYSLDYLVRSGYVWVDGTVLLSAFLLFLPYAKAMRNKLPAPDTRTFYFRRVRRIVPGYYFIILLTLFAMAIPWKLYSSPQYLVKDIATHLTFTHPFFYDTYIATPLGAVSWTVAIMVQAYALFPLIAKGVMKKPAWTLGIMAAMCFGFRAWCVWALGDYSMVVNQLLNFLDVYVIGILAAIAYVRLAEKRDSSGTEEKENGKEKTRLKYVWQAAATVVFAGALFGLLRMLKFQASSMDYVQIQERQMIYRPVYALCFTGLILSAPFSLLPLRKLLGNPVTKFLGGVSMNYYLIHQTLAVHLKRLHFPASASETPNMDGEVAWQLSYTFWCFGLSLLLAIAITYLIEKPAAKLLDKWRKNRETRSLHAA